jgi:hypothetical protein
MINKKVAAIWAAMIAHGIMCLVALFAVFVGMLVTEAGWFWRIVLIVSGGGTFFSMAAEVVTCYMELQVEKEKDVYPDKYQEKLEEHARDIKEEYDKAMREEDESH